MKRKRLTMYCMVATSCVALLSGLQSQPSIAAMTASDAPDTVKIASIAEFYKPVAFNHAMHTDITSNDCTICHHHTTGHMPKEKPCLNCHDGKKEASSVACKDCHLAKPFDAAEMQAKQKDINRYHIDKPGLKAAYHLNCLGCHKTSGGPVGCQDCHKRNEAGDKLFHAKTRK